MHLYKIVRPAEFHALNATIAWAGSADDARDGFVHLSTREQVQGTLDRHFAGEPEVAVLAIDPARLPDGALRWETSRGGASFPHLYAPLPRDAVTQTVVVHADAAGRLIFG